MFTQEVPDAGRNVGYAPNMAGRAVTCAVDRHGADEQLHLITFKWNVHTQGRTASQKYLTEIVHHNPLWMQYPDAARHGMHTGDLVRADHLPTTPTTPTAQTVRWWARRWCRCG